MAIARRAPDTRSPVDKSISISRLDGLEHSSPARSTNLSVVSPIAETTAITLFPSRLTLMILSATFFILSATPTEVPPNLSTIMFLLPLIFNPITPISIYSILTYLLTLTYLYFTSAIALYFSYLALACSSALPNRSFAISGKVLVSDAYLISPIRNSLNDSVGSFESSINGFAPSFLSSGLYLYRCQYPASTAFFSLSSEQPIPA